MLPTGILGTGATILSTQKKNNVTSVIYLSNPVMTTGYSNYTGTNNMIPGGAGGNALLLNSNPFNSTILNFTLKLGVPIDDTLAIYLNGLPIKDDNLVNPNDATTFDLINIAALSGYTLKLGDVLSFYGKDTVLGFTWTTQPWTGSITFLDGHTNSFTGGFFSTGPTDFVPHYRQDGFLTISR